MKIVLLLAITGAELSVGGELKQYWTFHDGSGSAASNAVAGGNAGALVNYATPGWNTDVPAALAVRSGGSLSFSSPSAQYVNGGILGLSSTGGVDGVTISCWLKPGVVGVDTRLFSMLRQTSTAPHPTGSIRLMADGSGQSTLQVYNGSGWMSLTSAGAVRTNQWQHLCLVWRGGQVDAYLNGGHTGWVASKFEFDQDSNGDPVGFGIGAKYLAYGTSYDGRMADLAVWKETLTPAKVRRLAAGESPLTIHLADPQYVVPLIWSFDDGAGSTATNSVLGGNSGTLVNFAGGGWNADVPNALSGRSAGSLAFSATNNTYVNGGYLGISSTGSVDGATLSCWLKPGAVESDMRLFSAIRKTTALPHPSGNIRFTTNAVGQVALQVATGTVWVSLAPTGAIRTNEWQHLCLTWRGNQVAAYINGTNALGWVTSDFEFDRDGNGDLIGFGVGAKYCLSYGIAYDGKMDELAVWNKMLSPAQIRALTSGVSPLEMPLDTERIRPERPLVQYRLDGNAHASSSQYDGVAINGASFTNGAGCVPFAYAGNLALALDGVNDEVTLANVGALRPGTNAWTVSLWFNAPTNSQHGALLANRLSTSPYTQIGVYLGGSTLGSIGTGRRIHYVVMGGATVGAWECYSSFEYADGGWHHLTLVCKNGGYPPPLYLDGKFVPVSVLRRPNGATDINGTDPWRIGSSGIVGYFFKGLIDEVAMWKAALTEEEIAWLAENSVRDIPPNGTIICVR